MKEIIYRDKILAHPERILERLHKWSTKPITIEIDLTNICNHNCFFCGWNRSKKNLALSFENIVYIINQIKWFVKWIIFSWWWEPFVNKHILDSIIYANSLGIDVGVLTNWWCIDKYDFKKLVSHTKWIRISVNWIDQKSFNVNHGIGGNEYFNVWKNIENLVNAKKVTNSHCTLGVWYLTNDNEPYSNIKKIVYQSINVWVDYIQFRPYHHAKKNIIHKFEKCKNEINNKKINILYSEEKYKRKKYNYEISFIDEFRTIITPDGDMYPDCYTRWIKKFCFWNIFKNTFDEIREWDKRKTIIKNKLKEKGCPWQCYQEPSSQILRQMYEINKRWKHINFI